MRRTGALSVRPGGRGASEREEGNAASAEHPRAMSPGTADPAEKTGRSIRRPARIRPLHRKPEPVSSSCSGRAPALHALRVSHDACFSAFSLRFRPCEAVSGRCPSDASRAPFLQRQITMPHFGLFVKRIRQMVSHKSAAALIARPSGSIPDRVLTQATAQGSLHESSSRRRLELSSAAGRRPAGSQLRMRAVERRQC